MFCVCCVRVFDRMILLVFWLVGLPWFWVGLGWFTLVFWVSGVSVGWCLLVLTLYYCISCYYFGFAFSVVLVGRLVCDLGWVYWPFGFGLGFTLSCSIVLRCRFGWGIDWCILCLVC